MAINLARLDQSDHSEPSAGGRRTGPKQPGRLKLLAKTQIGGPRKANLDDLVLFSNQLALLLSTGNSLAPSIEVLAAQMVPSEMKMSLEQVHQNLEGGGVLSDCLARHPRVFDPFYVSIIEAGEASGALKESLERLAKMLEMRRHLRGQIREALTYPVVLVVVMGLVIIFMMTYMFPRFSDLFAGIIDELPASTKFMLGMGQVIRSRWYFVLPILAVVGVGVRWAWGTTKIRHLRDRLKLEVPVLKTLYEKAYMFQLFASLGLLLASRVPHLEAVSIVRRSIQNVRFEKFFENFMDHLEAGRGVSQAFQESEILPRTVKLMVATGEASGALDTVLERLSDHYKEELETDIRRLSTVLEPLMLVIMGLLVGFVAISFIVPLFKLSGGVH